MSRSLPLDLFCDFGGQGPVVHLAHANGFPPGTYRPLAKTLTAAPSTARRDPDGGAGWGYHVIGMPARPLWPGSRPESAPTWHPLADDLVEALDALGLKGVVGLGHSLGGVCTMLAAIRRPDLFRAVILIDPVILPPLWLWALRLMRWVGLARRQPLVQGALRRRRTWPSRQACFEHYRRKSFFAGWSDESLWAYVEAGTQPRPDGQVELAYPPAWEAHIFATTPVDVWRYVPQLRVPTLVVRGEHSDTFQSRSQKRVARLLPAARFHVVPDAGHLVPMERPAAVGATVRAFLATQGHA